jgi:hypothetical protein
MANFYGNPVARYVVQGSCKMNVANWIPIRVGATNLARRQWLELQVRGTTALAIAYANKNLNGTFTTPTVSGHHTIIIPRNAIKIIPVSDDVTVYGRAVNKIASNAGGCKIVVAEFA